MGTVTSLRGQSSLICTPQPGIRPATVGSVPTGRRSPFQTVRCCLIPGVGKVRTWASQGQVSQGHQEAMASSRGRSLLDSGVQDPRASTFHKNR